ncbi:MAG: hypothetical protein JNM24_18200 [Bdellovibrionaceae bacterium]|nr:hypothetical protein [Pseudobdellovibrionaceae bacterium]
MFKFFLVNLLILVTLGCAGPGVYVHESDASLTETRKAIVKLYGEPRNLSQNGREIWTRHMDRKGRILETAKKGKERRYAHIKILGERRPYDILVNVVVEGQMIDGTYESLGDDEVLAEQLAAEIKKELLKSLENRNIIDDFNAF